MGDRATAVGEEADTACAGSVHSRASVHPGPSPGSGEGGGQLLTLHFPFSWLPTSVLSFYFGAARESPSPPAKLAPIYLLCGAPLLVAAEPRGQYLLQWVGNVTLL